MAKYTYDQLLAKLKTNLSNIPYTDFASVYNDVLGMDGAVGKKVTVEYPDDADEPLFIEEE